MTRTYRAPDIGGREHRVVKCPLLSSAHPDTGHSRGPSEHGGSIWDCDWRPLQAEWLAANTSPWTVPELAWLHTGNLVRRREGGGPGLGTAGAKAKEQTAW